MNPILVGYAATAFFTAGYVFYNGVEGRTRSRLFEPADRLTLWLTCVAVGAIWVLFTPALAALAIRKAQGAYRSRATGWTLGGSRPARAR